MTAKPDEHDPVTAMHDHITPPPSDPLQAALDRLVAEQNARWDAALAPYTVASFTGEQPSAEALAWHDREAAARDDGLKGPSPRRPTEVLDTIAADLGRVAQLSNGDDVLRLLDEVMGRLEQFQAVERALVRRAFLIRPGPAVADLARHVTQEEAAQHANIPLRTVRFLTRTSRVPSLKRGRHRMVRPVDLDEYLARCREQGVAVRTILDVSLPHDRRRGPRGAKAARPDSGKVR